VRVRLLDPRIKVKPLPLAGAFLLEENPLDRQHD
jgi:hypothetical protein